MIEMPINLNSSLSLSPMGCGTWAWGNQLLWDYDPNMDDALQQVFNLAVANGVTLFDTGDSYGTGKLKGRSESLLGQFLREYQGTNQDKVCLATKLAAYPWRLTANSMISAWQKSSERLGKNVDLVQMHWSTANYAPWQEKSLLNGLVRLYEQGKVKGVGLSNYGTKRLKKVYQSFADRGVPIATLQVQYSLLSTYPVTELGLKNVCDELGIQLIAYSPLALGLLTGKYGEGKPFPKGLRGFLFKPFFPKINPLLSCLEAIAQEREKTLAQIALNWCMVKGTIPIPGAKNKEQMRENIGALGWRLSEGEVKELDNFAQRSEKKMIQNIFQTR